MKPNPLFIAALSALVFSGLGGLWLINIDTTVVDTGSENTKLENLPTYSNLATRSSTDKPTIESNTISADSINRKQQSTLLDHIYLLLDQRQFEASSRFISENYSSLSSAQLEQLKLRYLRAVRQLPEGLLSLRLSALQLASEIFIDEAVWRGIAETAAKLEDWETTLQAQLNLFQFQSQAEDISQTLREILTSSSHLRSIFENRGDELSIKNMYERILHVASNAPRFQLELAYSHLRLKEEVEARTLLEQLIFDPDLGAVAQETLDLLNNSNAVVEVKPEPPKRRRPNGIVVPLESHGTSFIVNTRVEQLNTRLLLDTGASITALSRNLVDRLNLQPLNRQIRLNTANGTTTANLYRVERLQLGRLVLNDIVIADIDMGGTSNFQGLLGTDALNKLREDYDYLIDNGRKELIFRRK